MPLLTKPESCRGCPLAGDMKGFVPDTVVEGAALTIVAQNPGSDEEQGRKLTGYRGKEKVYEPHPQGPLLGVTGYDMDHRYLPLTGLEHSQVTLRNAIRCRVKGSNELKLPSKSAIIRQAIHHCQQVHFKPQASTQLYVAMGEHALYALTGEIGISEWRGWLLPERIGLGRAAYPFNDLYAPPGYGAKGVLATYHLAYLSRAPWDLPVAQRDWLKIRQVLDGVWPRPLPPIHPAPPSIWPNVSAFDTEFVPETGKLVRYSLAYRDSNGTPRLHVVECEHGRPIQCLVPKTAQDPAMLNLWRTKNAQCAPSGPGSLPQDRDISGLLMLIVQRGHWVNARQYRLAPSGDCIPLKVSLHWALADLDYLAKILPVGTVVSIEDTCLKHSVTAPDLDHDLGFIGSLYASINRWKHLSHANPRVYSGGDAYATLEINEALDKELERDPKIKHVYYSYRLPLVPIIMKARSRGILVNQENVEAGLQDLAAQRTDAQALAQAACGWPINVGSPAQVKYALMEVIT